MDKELQGLLVAYKEYEAIVRGRSVSSVQRYLRVIREFDDWCSARGDEIYSVSKSEIEDWLRQLFYEKGNLSNQTRATKLSAIKSFYRFLVERGYLSVSPAGGIPSPKIAKISPKVFPEDQVRLIFGAAAEEEGLAGVRDLAMLKLLYGAGPRANEVAVLEMSDVVFKEETCSVLFHGKGAKERVVKLVRSPTLALKEWYSFRLSGGAGPDDPFFTRLTRDKSQHGLGMSTAAVNAVLKKYAERVGIAEVEVFVHKMRSTFATTLYDVTGDVFVVAAKMGHEDIKTTMKYVAVSERALGAAVIPNKRWRLIESAKGGAVEG